DHPRLLPILNNLGVCYADQGKADLALPLLKLARKRSQALYGPNHSDTLANQVALGTAYAKTGQRQEARKLYEDGIPRFRATVGAEHPNALHCLEDLATLYQMMQRPEEALPLFEELLKIRQPKLEYGDRDIIVLETKIALLDEDLGKVAEAEEIWSRMA